MKRLLSIIMATTMILSMNVLTFAEETHEITKATFPLYNDINEMGIDMTLYFLDGATDLPYIEVNDWQKLIDGFFDTPTKHIGFSLKADGSIVTYTRNNDDPEAVDNGATMMLDLGTDIYTVSKLLGHREIATTQIYARVLDKNKQKAVSVIPQII